MYSKITSMKQYNYAFDLKGNSVHCIPHKAPQPEATKTPV